jgi:hypothetical protein
MYVQKRILYILRNKQNIRINLYSSNIFENDIVNNDLNGHLSNKIDCLCYQCLLDKYKKTQETQEKNNLIHVNTKHCLCYQCLLDKYQENRENQEKDKLENLLQEISK